MLLLSIGNVSTVRQIQVVLSSSQARLPTILRCGAGPRDGWSPTAAQMLQSGPETDLSAFRIAPLPPLTLATVTAACLTAAPPPSFALLLLQCRHRRSSASRSAASSREQGLSSQGVFFFFFFFFPEPFLSTGGRRLFDNEGLRKAT